MPSTLFRVPGVTGCVTCGGQLVEDLGAEGMICIDDSCPKYVAPSWRCTVQTCTAPADQIDGYLQRCAVHREEWYSSALVTIP